MTYKEFKSTYKWLVKHYPETTNLYSETLDEIIGTAKTERFKKFGSRWVKTEEKTSAITAEYYCNTIDAVWFFRNLGGSERVTMNYTKKGYLPIKVNSINPSRDEKTVITFCFN